MVTWVYQVTLSANDYLLTVDLAAINIDAFKEHPYRADNFIPKCRTIQVGSVFYPLLK